MKVGFSWPGFFFTWIWAFVKKLWVPGFCLLVSYPLGLMGLNWLLGPESTLIELMLVLAISLFVGLQGNLWLNDHLAECRYEYLGETVASNPEAAVAMVATKGPPRPS